MKGSVVNGYSTDSTGKEISSKFEIKQDLKTPKIVNSCDVLVKMSYVIVNPMVSKKKDFNLKNF
jgi:hypothetical protein